jgi:hypothetical protein
VCKARQQARQTLQLGQPPWAADSTFRSSGHPDLNTTAPHCLALPCTVTVTVCSAASQADPRLLPAPTPEGCRSEAGAPSYAGDSQALQLGQRPHFLELSIHVEGVQGAAAAAAAAALHAQQRVATQGVHKQAPHSGVCAFAGLQLRNCRGRGSTGEARHQHIAQTSSRCTASCVALSGHPRLRRGRVAYNLTKQAQVSRQQPLLAAQGFRKCTGTQLATTAARRTRAGVS